MKVIPLNLDANIFDNIILNMKYKLKCLLHDKISFGAVGPNSVCLDCDCGNMIYC